MPKRCVLLTFDDGLRENHNVVAPILCSLGIPAIFFVTTSFVDNRELADEQKKNMLIQSLASKTDSAIYREVSRILEETGIRGKDLSSRIRSITYRQRNVLNRLASVLACDFIGYCMSVQPYLTSNQIRDLMKQGFSIGAHSIDHPLYSELSLDEQLAQTLDSVGWLSSRFHYDCEAFAFPYRDAGISPEFFEKAFADGRLKVSFGTSGMHRHFFKRNLTRCTMEDPGHRAAEILGREFAVTLLRKPSWTTAFQASS